MEVYIHFDTKNETYDVMTMKEECIKYGDCGSVMSWLSDKGFHSDDCIHWENEDPEGTIYA